MGLAPKLTFRGPKRTGNFCRPAHFRSVLPRNLWIPPPSNGFRLISICSLCTGITTKQNVSHVTTFKTKENCFSGYIILAVSIQSSEINCFSASGFRRVIYKFQLAFIYHLYFCVETNITARPTTFEIIMVAREEKKKMPTARGVPRRSPIQVLTTPDVS